MDKPNFFDVKVLGRPGRELAQYLAKGRRVGVDGRLEWRRVGVQGRSGKRQAVEIVADNVQFLDSRSDGDGGGRWRRPVRARRCRAVERGRLPVLSPPTTTSRSRRSDDMAQKAPARKRPSSSSAPGRRKSCHFCKDKVTEVDYKNVNQLRRYISEKGKIRNRRITGACRRHQRQVAVAVKRAREVALLPYVAS